MGIFSRRLQSQFTDADLRLGKQEIEMLRRMHREARQQIQDEEQDLLQKRSFFAMVQQVEREAAMLEQHLEHIKQIRSLMSQKDVTVVSKAQQIGQMAKKLQYEDAESLRLAEDIRKRMEYIAQVAKTSEQTLKKDLGIDAHFRSWSSKINTLLREIEKHCRPKQ